MPVLLTEQEFEPWLSGTAGLELPWENEIGRLGKFPLTTFQNLNSLDDTKSRGGRKISSNKS